MADVSGVTGRPSPAVNTSGDLSAAARKLAGLQHMMRYAPKDEEDFNRRLDAIAHELNDLRQASGGTNRMHNEPTSNRALGTQDTGTNEERHGEGED